MTMEKVELPTTLKQKLASLEAMLKEQNPGYEKVLNDIHQETYKNPTYVYSLSDEEFLLIVQGYERYTKTQIDTGKLTKKQISMLDEDSV
jgi:hypothetical protein